VERARQAQTGCLTDRKKPALASWRGQPGPTPKSTFLRSPGTTAYRSSSHGDENERDSQCGSPFVLILRRSGLLTEDLDYHLVRASMVIMFLFFGYQKWWPYEAERLVPFGAPAHTQLG
jgi:hypothetical protein